MSQLDVPVSRSSLRHEIYDRLKAAIVLGEFDSSTRLTEVGIAERLGTSRAPVREALRELEQEGLVQSLGLRGYRVFPMTLKDVRELCMVRMALERLAVALLIDQGAKETVIALQKLVTTMRAARKDRPQLDELDEMFHERICSASGNELLLHTWHGMRDRLRIAMRATNTSFPFSEGIVESHKRVVDAIACDDRTQAESAVEEHIREGMTQLEASIRAVEEPAGGYQSSLPPTEVLLQ